MNGQNNVLVCVTPQESSKNLIAAGKALAEKSDAQLQVITVLPLNGETQKDWPQMLDSLFNRFKTPKAKWRSISAMIPTSPLPLIWQKPSLCCLLLVSPVKTATTSFP